jgi:NAD(P)H-hydrate repair Nnr-like enzyme with NAD(P)H-hydrate dehydratase domain
LATAGTGDILAGLIASFLVATKDGGDPFELVRDAVSLHSKAGRQAAKKFTSVTAIEVLEELRNV